MKKVGRYGWCQVISMAFYYKHLYGKKCVFIPESKLLEYGRAARKYAERKYKEEYSPWLPQDELDEFMYRFDDMFFVTCDNGRKGVALKCNPDSAEAIVERTHAFGTMHLNLILSFESDEALKVLGVKKKKKK